MVISQYLRDCGYRVIEAANADEALIVLQRLEIGVDIVFSDIEMPGAMDGSGSRPGYAPIVRPRRHSDRSVPRAAKPPPTCASKARFRSPRVPVLS